ncbi:membrane-associated progesterone receptor component 2-like [Diorhabda carinulata]|uniref:membrane-associated progesterone receptor component 2-like n=1 Tax=Diorhabda sublineata TaxID=1163346 RepID=UPI0024E0D23E|nr:membrane-associated progesterone receptor component 2-like [Diorhabda sublineata]XP_057655170.1 membrane-associated progesterone receptor component 2-like [Diorhabda carinulata]
MAESAVSPGILTHIFLEIIHSPLNIVLVALIVFLVYKIFKSRNSSAPITSAASSLPKLKKRDFTVEELKKYDGNQEDGRVLVAVNGNVYDVTKGKRFYGPGGPYAAFGGKDASRGLATFNVAAAGEGYDDLSDLSTMEMDSIREWESQFKEKYDFVGRLLKPGEQPTNYSDEEDESTSTGDKVEKGEKEEKPEKEKKVE